MRRAQIHMLHAGLPLCLAVLLCSAIVVAGALAASEDEPIAPIPAEQPIDAAKAALGERLFHDPRLSHGDVVACASCHILAEGGDDGRTRSVAANGALLDFNAPTVFNVALNFRLNWRGNFRTLEEQNAAVLLDAQLMGTNWEELLAKLGTDADYLRTFAEAYRAQPDRENVLDALAVYQRSLVTPDARFDRYLRGEAGAISAEEEEGYRLFKDFGCTACHQGVNVGGNLFQKFGVFANPFDGKPPSDGDLGRFTVTGVESDRHVFRVPSLRNVAVTAPYFHDGHAASLQEAVEIMGRSQLRREIAERDVDLIVKFLGTLTGEHEGHSLAGEAERAPQ
ncbi:MULTISPECIES: cytochrome c peroxidase [unclassified Sinorhizobium]|uniref:cytochrome-c peroxidase n=1 Tax=unclassified Sinorhizobium TaxID=2613772 RepID=UPI0024C254AF|nr:MULTISPECIES: cytochrome c peroxidase [unclassified Sinorhizobium]MDK1374122.1 cytochrome c peroxidase [Sinorhizobium sp. 6-70]MDK1477863.1 cytochrome c peroxidase [Sinorhizobium sp. 6-117]